MTSSFKKYSFFLFSRMHKRMSPHGDYNHMGYSIDLVNNLKDTKIYRTDEDGSVIFNIKNNKLKIETCSP